MINSFLKVKIKNKKHIAPINKSNTSKKISSWVASCSLNPPGLCRIHLGQSERHKSGMSVQYCLSVCSSISFRIKGFFKLPAAHLVRSSSSRMNTLTSISSFALQSVLINPNYLCIHEKYSHKEMSEAVHKIAHLFPKIIHSIWIF